MASAAPSERCRGTEGSYAAADAGENEWLLDLGIALDACERPEPAELGPYELSGIE